MSGVRYTATLCFSTIHFHLAFLIVSFPVSLLGLSGVSSVSSLRSAPTRLGKEEFVFLVVDVLVTVGFVLVTLLIGIGKML